VLVLALDTSTAAVTAALCEVTADAVQQRAERVSINARGHGEHLAPNIAACLRETDAAPGDLGAIVAGLGPGPFTGLRVGLVTAAVLAELLAIPAYGVCSLDGIAPSGRGGELIVATDARRKEVYWARYDAAGERVDGPQVARPADVPLDGITAVAGAGARLYQDVFGVAVLDADFPMALALVARAADRIRSAAASEPLTPLYLRRPDAQPSPTSKPVSQ
jgi:tRNA threonylcarbamoyl adenosine modification protein YeaZ